MRTLFTHSRIFREFDHALFHSRLERLARRWGIACALLVAAAAQFQQHFMFGLNASPSLPVGLFLIHKGTAPTIGDYVAFRWAGGGPHPAGTTFVKVIAGMPGDVVTRIDRDFFINGTRVGRAKPFSRQGVPLEPGPTGILSAGHYYVRAPHPDSLDSRYRLTGWITQSQIIGRAYALF
jgi:conjugal transfer pilin signal peptidase TrbI